MKKVPTCNDCAGYSSHRLYSKGVFVCSIDGKAHLSNDKACIYIVRRGPWYWRWFTKGCCVLWDEERISAQGGIE
jgi:hypothetical protein